MKLPIKSALCCALCVAAGTTFGQAPTYGTTSTNLNNDRNEIRSSVENSVVGSSVRGESAHFFKSKDLVGADIKDSQGNKLGDISELIVNHRTGEALASVDVSGSRHALVPIQAFQVTRPAGMIRNAEVTLNTTKAKLEAGPTITKDEWNRLDNSSFVQSVYSHYNVQQSSAMGGSEGLSTGGTQTGSGMKDTHDSTYNSTNSQYKTDSEDK